ncbi:MAG: CpsB/CapC family capsule biosynthesis tyrosine phosphatase [Acidobacteriota bacterium]
MIDLHSHILPGVDDGAETLEEALAMCLRAADDGCEAIVATPHLRHERFWNGDRALLEARCRQLRQRVGGRIEIHLGGEIAVHAESLDEIHALPGGGLLPLAGTRYLLLELPFQDYGFDPVEMVYELGVAGWRTILAHPERVAWLMEDMDLLRALVDHGAVMQVTAMSLTEGFGPVARGAAHRLMDAGLVHLVASDAHDARLRPTGLSDAFEHVGRHWGAATARALFKINPRAVLDDRPLEALPQSVSEAGPTKTRQGPFGLARRLFSPGLR